MAAYLPCLSVEVGHAFYADGRARALRFQPDEDTAAWLRIQDAVWRETGSGLHVHAPPARHAMPPQELVWHVRSGDARMVNITASLPRDPNGVLHFQAAPLAQAASGPMCQRLHDGAWVGDDDAWPAHPPGVLAGLLDARQRRLPPLFVLRLPAPDLTAQAPVAVHYRIAFAARAPVWKYCFVGDWPTEALQVIDAAQQVVFEEPEPAMLDDGQAMLAVRSTTGIALRERSECRFQLRGRSAAADRVLVKRLPVAGADHFIREEQPRPAQPVSEILVHR